MPNKRASVRNSGRSVPLVAAFVGSLLAAGITAFITFPSENLPDPPAVPASPTTSPPASIVETPAKAEGSQSLLIAKRGQFFDEQVEPQIAATDALNRAAADRCITRLSRLIDGYQSQVPPFVDDLTSWSTRFSIVSQLPGQWWNTDDRVSVYISDKFESHLFSEQGLTEDIGAILQDFRSEVDANQKRMLTSVHASLSTSDLPDINLDSYRPFFEKVAHDLQTYSAQQGASSVTSGVTAILVSEAGSYVAVTVVGSLFGRVAATGAVTAAVGAGATATGGAAGAGGGSVVGPAGTVVGLVVGLGVGMAIDWYMTDQFQVQLSSQMTSYLDSLRQSLLYGSPMIDATIEPSESNQLSGGVTAALPIVCDDLLSAYRERFYQQIVQPQIER
ncbi:hypothetical protein Poly51_07570 [Rubripirellula tenax]|uniref:Uncharacterized protein n=1 Tax=Rubripirellula tenax TaxID=2528015 RepID=A0A5C6FG24_9BACT|nr:hypothetical protein [Rubripirellula tenax]TWU60481.1 hypothetical protein Poly51_07570 [Rubripirellula tenax]